MFYAIRNTEAKGVYDNKNLFQEKLKECPTCSHRKFENKQEAINWAGVNGLANAKQQVSIQKDEIKNPLKKIIAQYENEEYKIVEITLANNESIRISLEEAYYSSREFDREKRNGIMHQYNGLNTHYLDQYYPENAIKTLGKSEMEYLDECFVTIRNCDTKAPYMGNENNHYPRKVQFHHQHYMRTINVSQIVSVKGCGYWGLEGHAIYDEDVLEYIFG